MRLHGDPRDRYREFAADAAASSACFADWAARVADDRAVLGWLRRLPEPKQQPNLVFAAARWHGVPAPGPYDGLRRALLADDGRIEATVRTRSTQTNEVGRLATLVPAFGTLPGPLALVEAGASAGLCLLPDRYDYAWPPRGSLTGSGGPTLTAVVTGTPPLPTRHPEVAWRAGVDLHPLDVSDGDATAWLRTLVWPEQRHRLERLDSALEVTRREPPRIVRGDLLEELPGLVAEAGGHGTPVVFHSAVIAYLEPPRQREFDALMRGLVADGACRWVANEAADVLPSVAATAAGVAGPGRFVLGVDGHAVAAAHGHGDRLEWW